jgi:outer membrane protein OmpA-like peptidoglycan-associated protein
MKNSILHQSIYGLLILGILAGCSSMNKTQKGAIIGTGGGAATGAVIGRAAGNTALGAIIGATVGGVTGAVIGNQMDKQAREIENELPDAKVERVGEGIVVELSEKILFDFNASSLTTEAQGNLDKVMTVLQKYPDTNIEIQGHTDNVGSESYNQGLSVKRAKSVQKYFKSNDISGTRLTTRGFGEEVSKYSNETDEGRAQNRRVEFLITANEKMIEDARKEAAQK